MSIDEFVAFGSPPWRWLAALVTVARAGDLFSTWLASPNLALEGNPIARRLGWRWGMWVNAGLVLGFACWPVVAISLSTTSFFVAARNLQQAWLMRSMGETGYRIWFSERVAHASRGMVWVCFLGEALMTASVGIGLLWFSENRLVPFGVGLGILAYGFAVAAFTSLALWRSR